MLNCNCTSCITYLINILILHYINIITNIHYVGRINVQRYFTHSEGNRAVNMLIYANYVSK